MVRLIALIGFVVLVLWALVGCASPNSGPYILPNPRCIIGCEATIVTQPIESVTTDDEAIKADAAKAEAKPPPQGDKP